MPLKFCHVSDLHGYLPPLVGDFEVVVSSGDFLPNRTFGVAAIETAFQPIWIEDNAAALRAWLDGKPILLTSGNHDFVNVAWFLRQIGIEAYNLDDKRVEFGGYVFYGFPWIPAFTWQWNFESSPPELEARTNALDLEGVDVLVAHSPLFGLRDMHDGRRCGSKPMRKFLKDTSRHTPRFYCCGHIHSAAGYQHWVRNIAVSNAACTQRVLTLT